MDVPLPPKNLADALFRNLLKEKMKEIDCVFHNYNGVLVVNRDVVVKQASLFCNKKEYALGTKLFSSDFHVPMMYGVLPQRTSLHYRENFTQSFLFMQRLYGDPPYEANGRHKDRIIKQFKSEITRLVEFGVYPGDVRSDNMIFARRKKQLYFFDFERWIPDISQVNEDERQMFRQTINDCLRHPEKFLF